MRHTTKNHILGLAVGNALEVAEAVKTLKKEGPEDLVNLCLELGTQMLIASKVEENADKARGMMRLQRFCLSTPFAG